MQAYLIKVSGFIGDCLFATSIAQRLKEIGWADRVDYQIPVVQPKLLMDRDPWIDDVYVQRDPPLNIYHKIIQVGQVDQNIPATKHMQAMAGIPPELQSLGYRVYQVPQYDHEEFERVESLRRKYNKPVVAWQSNWVERAYQTTPEEYEKHIGGPHRKIDEIIATLNEKFIMVEVGLPAGMTQHNTKAANPESYARTASFIKWCDYMIGAEGGLTNLAAGLGTKCIITTCFIHQVYGIKGHVRRIAEPQMGPQIYFPNKGHVHLPPFIPDEEVARLIIENIENDIS